MEFKVYRCREEGRAIPLHLRWNRSAQGELYVEEDRDPVLHRVVRIARIVRDVNTLKVDQLPPLRDPVLLSAKPSQWTITGWELLEVGVDIEPRAYQQSWILVPADYPQR